MTDNVINLNIGGTPVTAVEVPPPAPLDDKGSLLVHHIAKIKPLLKAEADAAALKAAASKNVTEAFNYATADLSRAFGQDVTRKFLSRKIEETGRRIADLVDERQLDDAFNGVLGIAVQADLFAGKEKGDTAHDQMMAHYQGYLDGVAGKECKLPDGMHPSLLQDYSGGWSSGQAVLMFGMTRGATVAELVNTPNVAPAVDLGGGDDANEDEDLDHEGLDDAARRLQRTGFAEKPEGEDEDPDAQAEANAREALGAPAKRTRRSAPKTGMH